MPDITIEKLLLFSDASSTMVTADAPFFGAVTVLQGRILNRGTSEAERSGVSNGFPPRDRIVAEATRFWIQHPNGVRERKTRDEMATLIGERHHAAAAR